MRFRPLAFLRSLFRFFRPEQKRQESAPLVMKPRSIGLSTVADPTFTPFIQRERGLSPKEFGQSDYCRELRRKNKRRRK